MAVRRTALLLILVVGIVLMIFPFVTNLFGKTSGTETLTDTFRPTFSDAGLAQTRADFDGVKAMTDQLQAETLPALPGALGMSDKQVADFLQTTSPDVAAGVAELPRIVPRFGQLVAGLEAQQANFEKADAIPTGNLPITTVPWIILIPGLALVAFAGVGLRRKDDRSAMAAFLASIVVGVVLAGAAVGLTLHSKGQAVDELATAVGPFFTEEGAAQTRTDMDTIQAMANQLQAVTIPALAEALDMSPKQFGAFLAKNFPDVANGVAALDTVLPRFQAAVTAISANVDNFSKTEDIPFGFMPTSTVFWLFFVPGLALIVIPAVVILADESKTRQAAAATPAAAGSARA